MTLLDFRELVIALKDKPLTAEDRFDLQTVIKNVGTYRTVGRVDLDIMDRLRTTYLHGD